MQSKVYYYNIILIIEKIIYSVKVYKCTHEFRKHFNSHFSTYTGKFI